MILKILLKNGRIANIGYKIGKNFMPRDDPYLSKIRSKKVINEEEFLDVKSFAEKLCSLL